MKSLEPQFKGLHTRFISSKDGRNENVLLLVHGRTGNIRLLEWYSKRLAIPELSFLLLEAPFPDQREDQKDPGFSWYLAEKKGIEESREKISSIIEQLIGEEVEARNIYWLGFSQGASMGLDYALRGSRRLGGFLCISGFCVQADAYPKAFGPEAFHQRILITHGNRDQIISIEQTEKGYNRLKELGVPFEYKTFDKPHSFHLKTEVPLLEETLQNWIRSR